jgi:hypothetical protein
VPSVVGQRQARRLDFWLLALAAGLAGCGDKGTASAAGAEAELGYVVYVGQVTADALSRLLGLPAEDVATERLAIDTPTEGAELSAQTPVAFAYRQMMAERRPTEPGLASPQRAGRLRRALAELGALLGPIRPAAAHTPPFNGTGMFLVVSDATGTRRLQVFTDQPSFLSTTTGWATLAAARQPLTLAITWAAFDEGRILDGNGPFVGGSVQFQIE